MPGRRWSPENGRLEEPTLSEVGGFGPELGWSVAALIREGNAAPLLPVGTTRTPYEGYVSVAPAAVAVEQIPVEAPVEDIDTSAEAVMAAEENPVDPFEEAVLEAQFDPTAMEPQVEPVSYGDPEEPVAGGEVAEPTVGLDGYESAVVEETADPEIAEFQQEAEGYLHVDEPSEESAPLAFAGVVNDASEDLYDIPVEEETEEELPEDGLEDFDINEPAPVPVPILLLPSRIGPHAEEPEPEPEEEEMKQEDPDSIIPDFDPSKYLNFAGEALAGDPSRTRTLSDEAAEALEGRIDNTPVEYAPVTIPSDAGPRDPRAVLRMLQELAALRD